MGVPTWIFLLCLCFYGTSADSGKNFKMFRDHAPPPQSAADEVIPGLTGKLRCHAACVRRTACLAFWISPSSCSLYDYRMDDTTLEAQTGGDLYNIGKQ